jgi:glycopeptide antibiotics resistance protein
MAFLDFFPYPFLLSFLILLFVFHCKRKRSLAYLLCFTLFYVYLLFVLGIVYFPIFLPPDWPGNITSLSVGSTLSRINFIPFYFGGLFSANPYTIFEQLAGNILLTLPFGFCLPFLTPISIRRMFWIALCAGAALEASQLLLELLSVVSSYGHAIDINDALLNAAGAFLGYGFFRLFSRLYQR